MLLSQPVSVAGFANTLMSPWLCAGYRHIPLRNECNQALMLQTIFVHIVINDYVPDQLAGRTVPFVEQDRISAFLRLENSDWMTTSKRNLLHKGLVVASREQFKLSTQASLTQGGWGGLTMLPGCSIETHQRNTLTCASSGNDIHGCLTTRPLWTDPWVKRVKWHMYFIFFVNIIHF